MALRSAADNDRSNAAQRGKTEQPEGDWLALVKLKAAGIHHGKIEVIFTNGRPDRIVRTESELLR